MNAVAFGYQATSSNQGTYQVRKTRRLDGVARYEAVAAIFHMGCRGLTVYAVSHTRARALGIAERALQTQSALENSLAQGLVTLTAEGMGS